MQPKALITGATGAIGRAIAQQMASHGYHVTIVARDRLKAEQTITDIKHATGNTEVGLLLADLSRKTEIEQMAKQWSGPLHVLINNAAATPRRRTETPEGIEMQYATNVLGYFWMINHFLKHLKAGAPSKIVNVASYWAGNLDINDLEFTRRPYNNDTAYRQSKQADRMLSAVFAKKLHPFGITVNAVHPGDVNSKLSNDLGYGGHETPGQGADTPVWAATDESLNGVTGNYFEHRQERSCAFARDAKLCDQLYENCAGY